MNVLDGVKVIDMATFMAAPTAARVLGEWGADCIKVEPPRGTPARTQGAVFNVPYSDDENLGFDQSDMNKRFITLDLKTEKGMEVMHKLLAQADVFVTNTRAKSLRKLGLDYDTLKTMYPRLIFAQVLGYGEHGPEKDSAGYDVTCYMARGGVFGTTVNRGDAPMIPTNGFGDNQVAMCLAGGICGALFNRERTHKGDKVTISLHHAGVFMLSVGVISAQYGNPYPKSRLEVINPFNNVYKTKDDKWVAMCAAEYDRDFNKIVKALGRSDLVDDQRYNNCDRLNATGLNSEMVQIMDEATKKLTRKELIQTLKSNDVACEACYEPLDMYKDEQIWANNIMTKLDCPTGQRNIATAPVLFESTTPRFIKSRAQGSDTEAIMRELGYSEDTVRQYMAEGAIMGKKALR